MDLKENKEEVSQEKEASAELPLDEVEETMTVDAEEATIEKKVKVKEEVFQEKEASTELPLDEVEETMTVDAEEATIEKKVKVKEEVFQEKEASTELPLDEVEETMTVDAEEATIEKKVETEEEVFQEKEASTELPLDEVEETMTVDAEEATIEKKVETEEEVKPSNEEDFFDFDGDSSDDDYSPEDRKMWEQLYSKDLTQITEKELINGYVVGITEKDVIINIGFKSDGLVALSEFRDIPDLKVGDNVEVYIEEQEDQQGQLVLSRRKAKIVKTWESIQRAFDEDHVIEGYVKRRTKGGLIMDIHGVEAFLPGSQIDVKPIRDFDIFVGKTMEVKVVKINYSNDNVVVSHKILIEKDIEQQKAEILNNLEKGQVLEGVIKNMTNFGVFIDLGGVDGLLHITDISWGRINHPEEVLHLDEKINVVVLDFDDDKQRISLGMKQLLEHPWNSLDAGIDIGSKVSGKIVNVADYGAFLEIIPGVEGLIHVSEMSWSQHLRNPSDFLEIGDKKDAIVLTLNREERKMSCGIKQLTEDPWTKQDILTKYGVGSEHKGIVRNLTSFGLFIELEEGIDGLVHVSDLSWTKKIKHPSEFVKVSEELEVKVMELDAEHRRLALSHKHLEENPWDTFETVFTKGSIHKCTITEIGDKFSIVELPYGLEGQVTHKNRKKEDGTIAMEGETLDFKILDLFKEEKKILLSHSSVWNKEVQQPKQLKGKKGKTLDKINKEVEKSTLGDLDALTTLKDKMQKK